MVGNKENGNSRNNSRQVDLLEEIRKSNVKDDKVVKAVEEIK